MTFTEFSIASPTNGICDGVVVLEFEDYILRSIYINSLFDLMPFFILSLLCDKVNSC